MFNRYFIFKKRTFFTYILSILIGAMYLQGCQPNLFGNKSLKLEESLAQKIMLDFRYYCPSATPHEAAQEGYQCKTPMTELPIELAQLITDSSLGGVILFAENIDSIPQTVKLTRDLQNAALKSDVAQPLFISTDQEGGRVVRIPRDIGTSFTGNMSIGATYGQHGNKFAYNVGKVLGSELKALGINVEHGPDVDVNVNLDNPVINVRSFGEDPSMVADLGIAMLEGIESTGVMATLKHFPGHGDTNTDSHTGLPKVMHDLALAKKVDLYPFQKAINNAQVNMIMTAHIQYPSLDSTEIVNMHGESMIKPATLSKKILTNLLRDEMGYQGLIITDALDMAGVSHFFTPTEAVLATFDAGADIAMMPIKIRTKGDIERFKTFINYLAARVKEDSNMLEEISRSVERIIKGKQGFISHVVNDDELAIKTIKAEEVLGNEQHRSLEKALAESAIVEIKKANSLTSFAMKDSKIHLVFPTLEQSSAMANYLSTDSLTGHISQTNLAEYDEKNLLNAINKSDVVIVGYDSQKSAVELGGAEDIFHNQTLSLGQLDKKNHALTILKYAKQQGKVTVFIPLKLPTKISVYRPFSDWILASFDGQTYIDSKSNLPVSPSLSALAKVLLANHKALGTLPITL